MTTETLNERAPVGARTLAAVEDRFDMPLAHAMETQRAIRRVLPDPVDLAIVTRCIELGLKGPSASNEQNWHFLVITDQETKAGIAKRYRSTIGPYEKRVRKQHPEDVGIDKMFKASNWQADNFEKIPVVVVPCVDGGRVPFAPVPWIARASYFGSIYPTVQNILLSARAVGLGANLVTAPLFPLRSLRKILGVPRRVTPVCVIPMGWPKGRYGPTTRTDVSDVVHLNAWGTKQALSAHSN